MEISNHFHALWSCIHALNLQENCQRATTGDLWFGFIREIQTASCDVIRSCAQEILQADFSDFMASGEKSLENSLDLFKNEYDAFVGSLPVELDRDTPCPLALETCTNLYTALYTLQSEISEGQPISQQSIETLLNAHGRMDKASEVEQACFWFEKYFWWRDEKRFVCTNSFTANQPRNKHISKRYSIPPVGPHPPSPPPA